MLIFDSHLDLAWNAVEWKRNLLAPVNEIREAEHSITGIGRGSNTVSYPELRNAKVFCCLATILTRKIVDGYPPFVPFEDDLTAVSAALSQVDHYKQMVKMSHLRQIFSVEDLEDHLNGWEKSDCRIPGFILSMEGADPILSIEQLLDWWNLGLRVISLVHYGENQFSHGTGKMGGLKPLGKKLLKCMEQYGFILDVTHLTDQATKEAMELFSGPVLASHHNCRTLVPGQRQLTDEQIRMMVERNAVIGVAFDNWMLYPNWEKGISSREKVTMDAVANHIDHICQVAGSSVNIGIGSDLDGGFGTEQSPIDLDTIVDIQRLIPLLERRGYRAKEIEGIMFRNWSEFFTRNLPTAESLLETEGK